MVSENIFSQYMYKTLPTSNQLWLFKKYFCSQMALSGEKRGRVAERGGQGAVLCCTVLGRKGCDTGVRAHVPGVWEGVAGVGGFLMLRTQGCRHKHSTAPLYFSSQPVSTHPHHPHHPAPPCTVSPPPLLPAGLLCYMLLLSGRSPSKILFTRDSGRVFQLDLLPLYGDKGSVERIEVVPYRLTRNLATFFTAFGVEVSVCVCVCGGVHLGYGGACLGPVGAAATL